jgi:hypothetical protein
VTLPSAMNVDLGSCDVVFVSCLIYIAFITTLLDSSGPTWRKLSQYKKFF